MRLSYRWLAKYIDSAPPPEKLGALLTMAGLSVESVERRGDDHIFEVEVTSNRPDALSVTGIAREVAALTGKRLKIPRCPKPPARAGRGAVAVSVDDKRLCPLYTARVIEGVTVGASPAWLAEAVEAMGLRPVNNVVDVTNFCLFETGEPMHAFDVDTLAGGTIAVRRARKGERIVTIDGVERALDDTMLVIADRARPVAIAGIMGGRAAEVTPATKNILLEAAVFEPVSVRRTSRRLGLASESSYRFERKIEPERVAGAAARACELIMATAGGAAGALTVKGSCARGVRYAAIRFARLNALLGTAIPPSTVRTILTALGCRVSSASKTGMRVRLPAFRQDLVAEIDLIEEVARVYGYDRIPLTLPAVPEDTSARVPAERAAEKKVRRVLTACGLDEIATYSLLGRSALAGAGVLVPETIVVRNPLSAEQEVMRPSLIPGILKAAAWNINRRASTIGLFEIGAVYLKDGERFTETRYLAAGMTGEAAPPWRAPARRIDFFDLKGVFETLVGELGIKGVRFVRGGHPALDPAASASIEHAGKAVGSIGRAAANALAHYDIGQEVYVLEVALPALLGAAAPPARYVPVPKYPSVVRDLSIVLDAHAAQAQAEAVIRANGGGLISGLELRDRYEGKQIPPGKAGLTYRIAYLDPSGTLEDARVNAVHGAIVAALARELGASLR